MQGWVKIHRKLRESPVYKEGLILLFLECLLAATHKKHKIDYAGKEYYLLPGQFVFGRKKWGQRLNMAGGTLYKRMKKIERFGIFSVIKRNNSGGTIYQIEKWEEYQQKEQQKEQRGNSSGTAREQLGNTNKKGKNVKNVNNVKKSKYASILSLTQNDFEDVAEKYKVPVSFVISKWDDIQNYCSFKGKKYKNYKAALMNWVKRDAIKLSQEQHGQSNIDFIET